MTQGAFIPVSSRLCRGCISRGTLFFLLTLTLWNPALAAEENTNKKPVEAEGFEVIIKGVKDSDLQKELEAHSFLKNLDKHRIRSPLALQRRIEKDELVFNKILNAKGYYDHKIKLIETKETEEIAHNTPSKEKNAPPPKDAITFEIIPGDRYKISDFRVNFKKTPTKCQTNIKEAGFDKGMAVDAEEVLGIFKKIQSQLATCGYPFSKIESHEVVLNQIAKTANVNLNIDAGPLTYFGVVEIIEAEGVPESFIFNRVPWKEGDLFNQDKVDEFRNRLTETRLFGSIILDTQQKNIIEDKLTVKVTLKRGRPRSLWGGARFSTGEGYGAQIGWTHRDITGRADRFRSSIEYGPKKSLLDVEYELPDFLSPQQTFLATIEGLKQRTKAYRTTSYKGGLTLKRFLTEKISFNYGFFLAREFQEERGEKTRTAILGLPLSLVWDTRKNILDPTGGWHLISKITPKFGHLGTLRSLFHFGIYGATYWAMDQDKKYILAMKARASTLIGGRLENIPPTHRMYLGGSYSIRAYQLHTAGPVDRNGDPIGGKNALEFGIEPRIKLSRKWGFVVFYEGGFLGSQGITKNFVHGAGFGVRYYTDFGPIRADIAFPLKKRYKPNGKPVDAPFQFYVRIGQSF